jgi:hypothetical protein
MTPVLDRRAESIRKNFLHFLHQDKMVALGKRRCGPRINNPIRILTFSKLMISSLNQENVPPEELDKFRRYLELIASVVSVRADSPKSPIVRGRVNWKKTF